jgi:hypothetical protein
MDGRDASYKAGARGFEKIRNNSLQKNQNQGRDGFSTPGPKGFAKAGGQNVSLSTDSWKTRQRPIYGSTPKKTISENSKAMAGTRKTHIVGHRGDA